MTKDTNDVVLLFDGVCNLCNGAINFVIDRDPKATVKFAALQSEQGKALIARYLSNTEVKDSLILIENGKAYQQSGAALRVAKYLNGAWPLLYVFIVVPPFIRNWVYDYVAKNRYNWYGKKDECLIPTTELKAKFL